MNDKQIEQIQKRIQTIAACVTGLTPEEECEIDVLRWVLTDVCQVVPWVVSYPEHPISKAQRKEWQRAGWQVKSRGAAS